MNFSSEELNLLIYGYLLESNFKHSAHVFANESNILESKINPSKEAPAGLINIVKKGLIYTQVEISIEDDGNVKPLPDELGLLDAAKYNFEENRTNTQEENENAKAFNKNDQNRSSIPEEVLPIEIPPSAITKLVGPSEKTFEICWNPVSDIFATTATNSTTRIWDVVSNNATFNEISSCDPADRINGKIPKGTDITCADWDCNGIYLATGGQDGTVQVWTTDGVLACAVGNHGSIIFEIKWNKAGSHILTAGGDNTVKIWVPTHIVAAKRCIQVFKFHTDVLACATWKTNTIFASSSIDPCIYVCQLHKKKPLRAFKDHTEEVGCIKWDPDGTLLASASNDKTVKIWSMDHEKPLITFKGHTNDVNTLAWLLTGSSNSNKKLLLFSASFDNTIRVWDVNSCSCVHILKEHTDSIYAMQISPNGKLLATGGFDKVVLLWNVENGTVRFRFNTNHKILCLSWNRNGNRIGAGLSDGSILLTDIPT